MKVLNYYFDVNLVHNAVAGFEYVYIVGCVAARSQVVDFEHSSLLSHPNFS